MKRVFLYLKYYFEPNEKMLSKLAFKSAQEYFAGRKLSGHPDAKYTRMEAFQGYQRGYKNAYRSSYARKKLDAKSE